MKVGLNVGSGQRPFLSTSEVYWYNIDSQEKWHPDMCCDATNIELSDEAVDYFILHHVLEHFGCNEGLGVIKEAYRLLKPGGSLIVSVPDLRELATRWLMKGIDEFIFKVNLYGAYMGDEADRHKWGFTYETLADQLKEGGQWSILERFNDRPINGASIAADWWILSMEAIK